MEVLKAINQVMGAMGPVMKEHIKQGNYNAFAVDSVYAELRQHFVQFGLVVVPYRMDVTYADFTARSGTAMVEARVLATYEFYSVADGSKVRMQFEASARDAGDKAPIQATQQALKYGLVQTFLIPAGDPTPEERPEPAVGGIDHRRQPAAAPVSEEEKARLHENAVKQKLMLRFGREKAVVIWEAGVANGMHPDVILDQALAEREPEIQHPPTVPAPAETETQGTEAQTELIAGADVVSMAEKQRSTALAQLEYELGFDHEPMRMKCKGQCEARDWTVSENPCCLDATARRLYATAEIADVVTRDNPEVDVLHQALAKREVEHVGDFRRLELVNFVADTKRGLMRVMYPPA